VLEGLIRGISPTWALRRERARTRLELLERGRDSLRRYEGADRGRRTAGWLTIDGSPTSATRGSLHVLRARSRDLRRNNAWAKSAVEALVSDVVGTGVTPEFQHESDAELRRLKELWEEWGETTACDADGGETFYGLQAGVCEAMVEGGECLVRRRLRRPGDGLEVPLQLQALEGDYLDTFREIDVPGRGGARTVQGKVYNGFGRLEGYWLFRAHPGDLFAPASSDSVFVPASEVQHVYRRERRGQVRGVPWGASVILRLHDLDAYEDNEALRMVVATSFSAFVKDMDADASFTEGVPAGGQPNALGQKMDMLQSGTVELLPPGKDIVFPQVPQNEGFDRYATVQLRAVARGYGLPYDRLTGDLSKVNFASGRMGWLGYQRDLERWRRFILIPHFCDPALRWWLEQAFVAGLVDDEGLDWQWIPPRREMIDPRTEVMANVAEVRAGFKSRSEVVQAYGGDPARTIEQLARDNERARELGLVLSTDGANEDPGTVRGVNAGAGAKPPAGGGGEDDEEDDEE